MLSISNQIQACSQALGGDLSGADTQGAASPTAPAACSSWRIWLLLPMPLGFIPPPTAITSTQPVQLSAQRLRQAPSEILSGCYLTPLCPCVNAPATHEPSCSPSAVPQTSASFSPQEQEQPLLFIHSIPRLALAFYTYKGLDQPNPSQQCKGQSLPPWPFSVLISRAPEPTLQIQAQQM